VKYKRIVDLRFTLDIPNKPAIFQITNYQLSTAIFLGKAGYRSCTFGVHLVYFRCTFGVLSVYVRCMTRPEICHPFTSEPKIQYVKELIISYLQLFFEEIRERVPVF